MFAQLKLEALKLGVLVYHFQIDHIVESRPEL